MAASAEDVRRGPGRPRKVSTVTKQEYVVNDEHPGDTQDDDSFSALFDDATVKSIAKVRVQRRDPNEGIVGYLEDPTMGEAEIKERWGGSTYLVQGIDAKGMVRKAAVVKIAGDPIFVSSAAEVQWRRSRGLPPMSSTTAAVVAADKGLNLQEMLMFIQTQDQQRRQEEREHQATLRKLELEAEERRRRETIEAQERARRDDEERERRRVKDEEDRQARRQREQQEAELRQQTFMQQTISMLRESNNQALQFVRATAVQQNPNGGLMEAVKTVVAIKEAFAGDEGGGEETPMNLLIKHGGEWINGLSSGIAGAVREIKAGGVAGQSAAVAATTSPGARPTAPNSPLALLPANHPINEKVETLVAKLAAKGLDPLAAMSTIVDNVLRDVEKIPQQGAPMPTAAADAPKPFTHDPNTVARVTTEPVAAMPATVTTSTPVAGPKVYRHSFGR